MVPYTQPNYSELVQSAIGVVNTEFSGGVYIHLEENVDTDQIIPAKYLTETKKEVFAEHCLEDSSIPESDREKLARSSILIAGKNFGSGSSREHAVWAMDGAGLRCVIAPSFARIFENNMFNNGLLCITLSEEDHQQILNDMPDKIHVNWEVGVLKWKNGEKCVTFKLSEYQKELIRNGGSLGVMLQIAAHLQEQGKL
jgi:3-isopropylmalate/(R)-2-methylmalate dehydratase small subunit